jgi:tRNA A-37 threonylcarbamoyl transferase component Bud32
MPCQLFSQVSFGTFHLLYSFQIWLYHYRTQFRRIVQDLHKAGVCHGDLRKGNMCQLDGHAIIIDFDRAFKTRKYVDFSRDELDLEHVLAR